MITKTRLFWVLGVVLCFVLAQKGISTGQEGPQTPGIEVQPRGPVHEAFVQPFDPNPGPGRAVPKGPPPAIPEKAADTRPQGDSAQWIPGYWAWDAARNDFIWISGTYRNAPAGRHYIPGQWVDTQDGWRWVTGYWASDSQNDPIYAAQPPASLDVGPSMPPPDDNSTYIPGYWLYRDNTFVWRPGFYASNRAGRTWVSPRYVWTPQGYLYVDGYWDYALADRGLLFAPVWFNSPFWRTPGWNYRPNQIVPTNAIGANIQRANQLALARPVSTPVRLAGPAGVPRVVNNSPRVVNSFATPNVIPTAPTRLAVSQPRAFAATAAPIQHHAAPAATHAAHATSSHSHGGGGHGRR